MTRPSSDDPFVPGGIARPSTSSDSRTSAGRYAPSPTGPLHLGNLRTAVLAWLFARSTGRRFLLRMEDLDRHRVRPGFAQRQAEDLAALGVTFDDHPVLQSERFDRHEAALDRLQDVTYECFCSRREITDAASAPHEAARRYPGTCRHLSTVARAERRLTRTPALRLRAEGAVRTIQDALYGSVTGMVDDLVLRRNDGVASYHLAVVVDDAAMGVDQVVRADDLLTAAPGQAHLADLLGLGTPTYAHVPLVLNQSGTRLAKRDGAVTLADLAAAGVTGADVLAWIAVSLSMADCGEPVTMDLLLDRFDPAQLPREPWLVQPRQLTPDPLTGSDRARP